MRVIGQHILLITSFTVVFAWQKSPLSSYTVHTIAVGVVIYVSAFLLAQRFKKKFKVKGSLGISILNASCFLLVFATGGLSSSLFFLLYFVGFGVAFSLNPTTAFVFAGGAIAIFLEQALKGDIFSNFVKVGSLALVSPFAFFFAREFQKKEKDVELTEKKKERIISKL